MDIISGMEYKHMKNETKTIRTEAGQSRHREHRTPIYMTSGFTFDSAEHGRQLFSEETDGNIYSRFSNPNTSEFAQKMCGLEKMDFGFPVASGMAAVFAGFAAILKNGDHIVASRSLFGSSIQILKTILPKWGISTSFVDAANNDEWSKAITPQTKMLFVETPSNPGLDLIDLSFIGKLKSERKLLLHVDNTFATPVLQTPADFGADIISHSTTKYIDGQGRTIGGIILSTESLARYIQFFCRQTGPAMSPFNAWLLSNSLETLNLRVEKHCNNALKLAEILEKTEGIESVKYPLLPSHPQHELAKKQMSAGGGIVTFEIKGGFERAKKFIDSLEMSSILANLGDTRTIVTHPASTTHSKLSEEERRIVGISPGLIRISVGLESYTDIEADIINSIEKSGQK